MKRTLSITSSLLILALLLAVISTPMLVKAAVIPTISITKVEAGKTVTIQTHNYPANDSFDVLMGKFGTKGVGGTKVDTVSSGSGGSMSFTFNIPSGLASEKQIAIRLQSPKSGYYSYNWFYNDTSSTSNTPTPSTGPTATPGPTKTIPTISITKVEAGKTVSIKTYNYPANDSFEVLMGKFGTRGVGGVKVDTVSSGKGGSLEFTFNIPSSLASEKQIAIRLQSPKSGYYSYDWFNNVTGSIPNTGSTGSTNSGSIPAGTIPTISIVSVEAGKTVKVSTKNYPSDTSFDVYMGKFGTKGIGGVKVDTINSGTGGTQSLTFNIPASLASEKQIAIRLQAPVTGYFSYNWFWNNTSSTGSTTGSTGSTGGGDKPATGPIPTISITSVVHDGSVTVKTKNYPANDTFDVYMGKFGTKGIGGVKVDTVTTGEGGTLSFTFNIPDSLKGETQIAIRLQSPKSGFFSYNWFWNNTAP